MTTEPTHYIRRRTVLQVGGAIAAASVVPAFGGANAAETAGPKPGDRVFLTNEDSTTLTAIVPVTDEVIGTVNLTSFDAYPRPPFRFVPGGFLPAPAHLTQQPLSPRPSPSPPCRPPPAS